MKKLIGILRPFDLEQTFVVYEDGQKIDTCHLTTDEILNAVPYLCEKYNITQVDLTGPKQYSKGIQHTLENSELIKYNTSKININII